MSRFLLKMAWLDYLPKVIRWTLPIEMFGFRMFWPFLIKTFRLPCLLRWFILSLKINDCCNKETHCHYIKVAYDKFYKGLFIISLNQKIMTVEYFWQILGLRLSKTFMLQYGHNLHFVLRAWLAIPLRKGGFLFRGRLMVG